MRGAGFLPAEKWYSAYMDYPQSHPLFRELPVSGFQGGSLKLIQHDLTFAPESLSWVSDPEMGKQMGADFTNVSIRTEEDRIRDILANRDEYHWVISLDGKAVGSIFIGFIGAVTKKAGMRADMMSYLLSRDCRRKGIMTAVVQEVIRWALDEGGFEVITSRVLENNAASISFLRKIGFTDDGTEPLTDDERSYLDAKEWRKFCLRRG